MLLQRFLKHLPPELHEWLSLLSTLLEVLLIVVGAWALVRLSRMMVRRLEKRYLLPYEFTLLARRALGALIWGGAFFWVLERLGVSASVLWTAFTSFAAVGAVAFFAAWSVLSNMFCSLLIWSTRIFRLHDVVEVCDANDKPGFKGRVIDINLIYTTLEESGSHAEGTTLKIPNSLFFQRFVRRWHGMEVQVPGAFPFQHCDHPPRPTDEQMSAAQRTSEPTFVAPQPTAQALPTAGILVYPAAGSPPPAPPSGGGMPAL